MTIRCSKATFSLRASSLSPSSRCAPNPLQGRVRGKHKAAAVWQHFYPSPATVVGCHFPTQAEPIRNNSRAGNGKQANTQSTTPAPKKPPRPGAETRSAAKGTAETHAEMQRERSPVPNMAESRGRRGRPGSGRRGGTRAPGAPTHTHPAPGGCGAGRASPRQARRDLGKPNFPLGSPGPPETSTESIFRRAWKAPAFLGRGRAAEAEAAPCAAQARTLPRAALCARCQRRWRPETHFGAPAPRAGAANPAVPGPAGQCAAPGAGAGPGDVARVAASARASPPPPGPPRWPRPPGAVLPPGAGPSPGVGPCQAHPIGRAPCVPWQVRAGRAEEGGTRARSGTPQPVPRGRSRRLQEAVGWLRVRELVALASSRAA